MRVVSKFLCALMTCLISSSAAVQPGTTYLTLAQGNSSYRAGSVEPTSGMQDPRTYGLNAQGLHGGSGGQAWAGSSADSPTGLSAQMLPASVFLAQQRPLQSMPLAALPTGQQVSTAVPVPGGSAAYALPLQQGQAFTVPANCDVPAMLYFPSVPTTKPIPTAPAGHDPQQNLQERRDAYPAAVPSKIGTFVDTDYLEDLAIAYHAQSKQSCGDDLYCKILRDRACALHLAAERPDVTLETGMSKPFDQSIVKLFPEVAPLARFGGNLAQYRLYQEVMHNLQDAVEQFYTHRFSDEATAITPLAINLLTGAAQQENPAVAFLLTDSSYHLLRFNDIVNKFFGFLDGPNSVAAKLVIGGVKGTINAAQGMAAFVARVCDLAVRLYKNPNQVVPTAQRAALGAAKACFEAAILLSCQDRDLSQGSGIRGPAPNDPLTTAHQHEFVGRVQSFLDTCYGDPEQGAALIVEQLWYGAAAGKAVQGVCVGAGKAVGGAKALAQAVRTSQEVNWCLDDLRMAYLRWKSPARAAALASEVGPYEQFFTPLLKEDAELAKAASNIVATQEAIKGGEQVVNKLVDQRLAIRPAESMINEGLEKVAVESATKEAMRKIPLKQGAEEVLRGTVPGPATKGKTSQFLKECEGCEEALLSGDFESFALERIGTMRDGKFGYLKDGRVVNMRTKSSFEAPTLEIYNSATGKKIKIRYIKKQ